MTNQRSRSIIDRIPETANSAALRAAAQACFDVADAFKARADKIAKDPALTDLGRRQALHDEAVKTFLPQINVVQAPIAKAAADALALKAAISIPAPDPTNLSAALERQEIRAMVREMTSLQRVAYLLKVNDERIVDAVLSAPPVLTGLTEKQYETVRDATIERRFGDRVAEIRLAQDAVAEADNARKVALNDIRAIVGSTEREFAGMMKRSTDTPWLIRDGDKVLRVIPGERHYPLATAEELALGKFYANETEFKRDHGIA